MSGLAVLPRLSDSFQISKKIPRKSSGFREQVGLGPLLSKAQNPNSRISDFPDLLPEPLEFFFFFLSFGNLERVR